MMREESPGAGNSARLDRGSKRVLLIRGSRRSALLACAILVGGSVSAYLAREPILRAIGHQLVHADPAQPSDAILVLAGGVFDRELEAADLYLRGLAPLVLMTREPEPRVLATLRARGVHLENSLALRRRVLHELGVPADRIHILDGVVTSTHDEAEAARDWAARSGATSLIVVTSSFHTARTRFVLRAVFEDAGVVLRVVPASASDFDPDTWWTRRTSMRDGLIEWQKMIFYRIWY